MTHPDADVVEEINEHFVAVKLETGEHTDLARGYEMKWMPGQVILSPKGRVEHRWIGFLGPANYRVELLFGRALSAMGTKAYEEADTLFATIADEHPAADRTPEAIYWWGVSQQRRHKDKAAGIERWARLVKDHPDSAWTERVGWMV